MEPVRSFFLTLPYPITTISFRLELLATRDTVIPASPRGTSRMVNPTEEKIRLFAVRGTESWNSPFALVVVPRVEPAGTTETPGRGLPSFESVTFPEMVLFCANKEQLTNKGSKRIFILASNRFFIFVLVLLYKLITR